jgi:hypothetical protein
MRTISLATLALCALSSGAFADYIIEEKMEHNDGPPQEMTIKLKEGKARCDIGGAMTTIMSGGQINMLMHAQKMAMKMPAGMMLMPQKKASAAGGTKATLKPTGRKEKINGFETEEFVHENPALKATMHLWIAKDFPDKIEVMKMMNAMQTPMTKQFMQAAGAVAPEDYPGLPIRTELESSLMGKPSKTIITITSIKKEPVDDSAFVVPADYRQGGPGLGNED